MAWCPKCKCEYVEGIEVCSDCGCNLVQDLNEAAREGQVEITPEMAMAFIQAMQQKGMAVPGPKEEDLAEGEEPVKFYKPYINNEEKAEDNKASAYTLLLVGGVGLAFIVLMFLEVLPIRLTVSGKYMICGVMGVMFILFIVMGIVSMRNSKILKKKAKKENNLTREIKRWCVDVFNKEEVDEKLQVGSLPEELKYFQRYEYMKKTIKNQFMNLDEAYLDRLIEEIYPEIFEKEEA